MAKFTITSSALGTRGIAGVFEIDPGETKVAELTDDHLIALVAYDGIEFVEDVPA